MKNVVVLIFSLFLVSQFSFGEDYNSFMSDLRKLKLEYRFYVQNEKEVYELENKMRYVSSEIYQLKNEAEKYVEINKLSDNEDFHILLTEIYEFENFLRGNSTCECLCYFNKFLNEIGAQSYFLKQQEDINIFVAFAGNFKFYYAYSLNNWLKTVTINTKMTNGYETFKFGLYEEIEIFKITSKLEKTKSFNVKVKIINKEKKHKYNECEDTFPRL